MLRALLRRVVPRSVRLLALQPEAVLAYLQSLGCSTFTIAGTRVDPATAAGADVARTICRV